MGKNPGPCCEGAGGVGGEVRDSKISSISPSVRLQFFPFPDSLGNFIVEPPLRFQAFWGTPALCTLENNMLLLSPQRITESLGRTGRKECQMRVLGKVTS